MMKRAGAPQPVPLVVQQSFPEPRRTTNPYLVLLRDCIAARPGVEVRTFGWRQALLGRYHLFHLHWPDILVSGRSRPRALVRQLLTLALLLRLRMTQTPLVRTLHNLGRPDGISWLARAILAQLDRQTTLVIRLNSITKAADGVASVTIPHGHYRDWFEGYEKPDPRPGRLSYFGLIKPYKGVDQLLSAFADLSGDVTLRVAGQPTPALVGELTQQAARDGRVEFTAAYVDDAELVRVVCGSELVVLPYRAMHNSGGALAALSLDRPILVPQNEVNDRLSEEVGPGWVLTYRGPLTGATLARALASVRTGPRSPRPDLSGREWDLAGERHVAAYRLALSQSRRRDRTARDAGWGRLYSE
jgi:beta-1,4-mannosyltransferase